MYKGLTSKIKAWYMAAIQRWGIRNVNYILTQPFRPFQIALKRLGVPPQKIIDAYFPLIIDLDIFKYDSNYKLNISAEKLAKMEGYRFKIFHPSRLMTDQHPAKIEAGQWKGNDKLLKGLRIFIDLHNAPDICIMLPDRGHSAEKNFFLTEIERLGLQNNVIWLQGKSQDGFDKAEMIALYSASDLVVDEFGVGWFGSIVVESAACSRPIMCHLDEESMKKMYPYHPVISVNTPELISEEIAKLYFNKEYSLRKGNEGRLWAKEFHGQENAGRRYASQILGLLAKP